ncbi:MAG: class I SAM-dependent methyltransferase [Anaeromyxobacter sp.]|nr:class I SAM-dependent methyltransferase [Anaeromyxobacter sp.]MBL0276844.1 class I SAM-dependent methyltransferase [Anaeromyxobacter sp.]
MATSRTRPPPSPTRAPARRGAAAAAGPARPRPRPPRPGRAAAPGVDRHVLYARAVQHADSELELLEWVARRAGRPAQSLREDFCGTALLASSWIGRGPRRTATAVDLDPEVLAWARTHRLPALGPRAGRLRLVQADVRRGPRGPFDAVLALNFSYQVFTTREALRGYLASARRALAPGGVMVLDAFGGWLAQKPLTERRRIAGGVTYVWQQEAFDPITHRLRCAIHFQLPGGQRLRRAFTYDWRLWTLPELTELMAEAGFEGVEVLWDPTPQESDPAWEPRRAADNQPGFLAYVTGRRPRR